MKYFHSFFFHFTFFSLLPLLSTAQSGNYFNLNIDNGLPSNQVYGAITDKHGYLWITTPKGVARYNGYDFKLFNLSEGLPYEDVWQLLEDKKGRIWLGNISDEIGYIYNNKYHKTSIQNLHGTIYPRNMQCSGDGIVFWSHYMSGSQQLTICEEKNDTFFTNVINESLFTKKEQNEELEVSNVDKMIPFFFINATGEYIIYAGNLYKINQDKKTVTKLYKLYDRNLQRILGECKIYPLTNHFIWHSEKNEKKYCMSMRLSNNYIQKIAIKDYGPEEDIRYIYRPLDNNTNNFFFLITSGFVYQFQEKDSIRFIKKISLKKLIDGSNISFYNYNKFWGSFIGTTTNGLYLNNGTENNFIKENKIKFHNYKYVGNNPDRQCFWWNQATGTLIKIEKGYKTTRIFTKDIPNIYKIIPYNNDFLILSTATFLLKPNNAISVFPSVPGNSFAGVTYFAKKGIFITADGLYMANDINNHYSTSLVDADRYRGIIYDSLRKNTWAYNNNKIFVVDSNYKTSVIENAHLDKFGIKKIESIVFDNKYGNIFFKGQNNITIYNSQEKSYRELFRNFNLKESSIYIYDNKLIVVGRFGVIFNKILGPDSLSKPLLFSNIKNVNYNYITDCQISWNKLLLNTDKGDYSVIIPDDSTIINSGEEFLPLKYNFVINYKDSVFNVKNDDTILINQKDIRIQLDVINSLGNGQLKFNYRLPADTVWHELNTNELNLPPLAPDNYYKLSINAHDNVWRSDDLDIYVYVQPYWWQTHNGRRITWGVSIILVLLLFTAAVLITRRLVLRATKKRNLQMELELKSIYAQINPHFIFNTLNSALLLVSKNRMEEAYIHIAKFSRLLRSYIKSSRNKYISIAEEIKNLKYYIELQQTRFKNKFEFSIVVDKGMDQEKIKIPALLLQPFVENAINHGILNKQTAGNLKIEFNFSNKKNEIICVIDDDGVGRKHSKFINEYNTDKEESYGDLLIKDLVNIFNKYEQMNIEINYTDKEAPDTGTTVTINIKNFHSGS